MTTATRRLRRASIAGLATVATVGGMIFATGGTAFAALANTAAKADGAATTVTVGSNGQAIAGVLLAVPNTFGPGDVITLTYGSNACTTNTGNVSLAGTPSVAVTGPFTAAFGSTAGSTGDTTPTFSTTLGSSSSACSAIGVKDQITISFTNFSTTGTAGDFFTLALSGLTANVGTSVAPGALQAAVTTTDKGGLAVVASGSPVTLANVVNSNASETEVAAAPSSSGVAINPLTLTELTAGTVFPAGATTTVTLKLAETNAGTAITPLFTAGVTPTVTVPSGYTATAAATTAANTYTFTVKAPATAAAATVTVSGLKVDLKAAGTGVVTLTGSAAATIGASVNAIGVANTGRTGGIDRYATAAKLFTGGTITNATAVLASGANFPDALSANYLAGNLKTGILLTDPNVLPQATQQALIAKSISTVYIVGGNAAVSSNVQATIAAMHVANNPSSQLINVIRLAGADRFGTNNAVDLQVGVSAGITTAYVATGNNFADALSIGPAVVAKSTPLVLTDGTALSADAQSTLVNLGIKNVIILGGTNAVSSAVETAISNLGIKVVYRIGGADRTQTASLIATYENGTTAALPASGTYSALDGLSFTGSGTVWVSRGDNFPDALAAGPLAGTAQNEILLSASPTTLGAGVPSYLKGMANTVTTINALGLTSAVSVGVLNSAVASLS